MRDLFEQARAKAPAIIFIDELDALGRARGAAGPIGGHDEREQTTSQGNGYRAFNGDTLWHDEVLG